MSDYEPGPKPADVELDPSEGEKPLVSDGTAVVEGVGGAEETKGGEGGNEG